MTDDIVARLRTWSADESTWDLLTEAADEIERLRERGDDWHAAMTENHDLWRENERLRARIEALEGEIRETAEASND
jgi:predicted RNase H-like nuclease (RuvC/YqgF family)